MGRLEAIWLKRAHRGPMDEVTRASVMPGQGMAGSVGRSRRRQVTIIAREQWDQMMRELGASVDPSARRANLMVSGLALESTRGRTLCIGSVRITIGGETTPCERMEEAHPGLQATMKPNWRGGAFGQVVNGGEIAIGDAVTWCDMEPR